MFMVSCDDVVLGMMLIVLNFKVFLYFVIKRALGSSTSARTCVFNKMIKMIECVLNVYLYRFVMLCGVQSGEVWKLFEFFSGLLVEEIEGYRVFARLYVGCVFIVRRKVFIVQWFDIENCIVYVVFYEKFEMMQMCEWMEVEVFVLDLE